MQTTENNQQRPMLIATFSAVLRCSTTSRNRARLLLQIVAEQRLALSHVVAAGVFQFLTYRSSRRKKRQIVSARGGLAVRRRFGFAAESADERSGTYRKSL